MQQISVTTSVHSTNSTYPTTHSVQQLPRPSTTLLQLSMKRSMCLPVDKYLSSESLTEFPPCGNPVFNSPGKNVSPPPGFAPKSYDTTSHLGDNPKNMCSLENVFSSMNSSLSAEVSELLAGPEPMDLDSSSSLGSNDMYTPPTSPDSMMQSPLVSPRFHRLPIFSQISQNKWDIKDLN